MTLSIIKYLDTQQATIKMLRDYRNQQWKAEYGRDQIRQIKTGMERVTATLSAAPKSRDNGRKTEETLIAGIDKMTIAEQRYQEAVEYMELMDACLGRLSEQERRMLELRYIDYEEGNGIPRIMEEFHVGQADAYRRSNQALERLRGLIYW